MAIFYLIIFCSILSLAFYVWDTLNHKKFMINKITELHWQEKYSIAYKVVSIKDDYPTLARVANSMANSTIRFDSKEIVKYTRPVVQDMKEELRLEIKRAVNSKNEDVQDVIRWYFMACLLVTYSEQRYKSVLSISEDSKRIERNEFDKFNYDDTLCFV